MGAFSGHLSGALSVLSLPVNLAALLAGLLSGVLAARLITRAGLELAVIFALLFPLAALLDPATGLILLGSAWSAALVATATPTERMWRVVPVAIVVLIVLALVTGPAAALLPKLAPVEKVALLAMAAALAVIVATNSQPGAWLAATALTAGGLALELSPLQPLDGAKASPRALLLGLLAVGPALVALLRPQLPTATMPAGSAFDKVATVVPLLLFAMPVTLTAALFTLALGEHGLAAGHALMTQRPRLALSFALALVIAALTAAAFVGGARRLPRPAWWPASRSVVVTRVCASIIVLVSAALLLRVGTERGELVILAIATLAGGLLHWLGRSPGMLIVGMTIGEVMRPALTPALKAGVTDARAGLFVGLAALTLLAAVTWPWLTRLRHATVGQS